MEYRDFDIVLWLIANLMARSTRFVTFYSNIHVLLTRFSISSFNYYNGTLLKDYSSSRSRIISMLSKYKIKKFHPALFQNPYRAWCVYFYYTVW